ncbi:hypothetical protein ACP90_00090 [Labrenzia sp. CP4]|nr:hypothetical protein ACP90_00090 [Labrenzia sp. CP4]
MTLSDFLPGFAAEADFSEDLAAVAGLFGRLVPGASSCMYFQSPVWPFRPSACQLPLEARGAAEVKEAKRKCGELPVKARATWKTPRHAGTVRSNFAKFRVFFGYDLASRASVGTFRAGHPTTGKRR